MVTRNFGSTPRGTLPVIRGVHLVSYVLPSQDEKQYTPNSLGTPSDEPAGRLLGRVAEGWKENVPAVMVTTETLIMNEGRDNFEDMFRSEFPRLAGYSAGLVGNPDTAADIAQEALVRTWARWPKVANPQAYAYLVATNLAKRHWRQRGQDHRALSDLKTIAIALANPVDTSLRDLVERLPVRLRTPVLLHYYADLSIEEVALLLHRPAGTMRRHIYEARRLLAVEFELRTKDD